MIHCDECYNGGMDKVLGDTQTKNLPGEGQSSFRKKLPLEQGLEGVSVRRESKQNHSIDR